jgi:hypothetical protein
MFSVSGKMITPETLGVSRQLNEDKKGDIDRLVIPTETPVLSSRQEAMKMLFPKTVISVFGSE